MTYFQWLTIIVSVAGAIAAWIAFIFQRLKTRQDRAIEMGRKWSDLAKERGVFWSELRKAYDKFRSENPHAPESLDELIDAAGLPPDLFPRNGRDLFHWPSESASKLGPDKRLMWIFVSQVYPPRDNRDGEVTDYSSVDFTSAVHFHRARGAHAHFWKNWAAVFSTSYLCRHYTSARRLVAVLCWLELALVQWTQDPGEGKTILFRFAQKLSQ